MWSTPEGDRKLVGAEAALVRQSLAVMVDQLAEKLSCPSQTAQWWDSGVTMFDELTSDQQLVVIRQVVEHLLRETPDTLELTAVNEAAVYAIFATIASQIEIEIDMSKDAFVDAYGVEDGFRTGPGGQTYWRQRVLDACRETVGESTMGDSGNDPEWALPPADCGEIAEWIEVVEVLADRILWDRDFEMGDSFLDTDPAQAATMKQLMGIDQDYYASIAEDPGEQERASILESVRRITHGK